MNETTTIKKTEFVFRRLADSFDQFVVLLKNSVSQMVYKHAISTVVPARNVRLTEEGAVAATETPAE